MLKGNDNHPMNFTNTYDMLMHFELAAPRHHNTGCTVDRGNRKNSEVRGGRDHTFIPRTTLSVTIFSPGLDNHRSYNIKCSIVKNGTFMKTNDHKQHEITLQTTQDTTWIRSEGASHRASVMA